MHIGILTCVWKRAQLFKLFASALQRLQLSPGDTLTKVAVGSEGEVSRSLCRQHGFHYLEAPNEPVSDKFNAGLGFMRQFSPDYVLILGSDDVISPNFLAGYAPALSAGAEVVGLRDLYFFNVPTQEMIYFPGYQDHRTGHTLGTGRVLSKPLLEKMDWNAWVPGLNKGLDNSMLYKLSEIPHRSTVLTLQEAAIFAMDIKTDLNITPFEALKPMAGVLPVHPAPLLAQYLNDKQHALLRSLSPS